ncbi:hypothetical protein, conserved [Babesia ovata]|uniref:Extracellular matrix-binding ebh n=1 Tax=Babesia ovata TaxID=189622 RepID=A0A2H6KJK8_9APIC|nr:uncharacterized protein BOVATA_046520 [Babesia ovata]GBE63159.1 hypothetical protein, conserved [Babesia ovata]
MESVKKQLEKLENDENELTKILSEQDKMKLQPQSQQVEEHKKEIETLKTQIFQQSSKLQGQITSVISAVEKQIKSLEPKKNKVDKLQSQVNELKKKIDAKQNHKDQIEKQLKEAEKDLKEAQNDFPEKESKSLDSHQASMKSLGTLNGLCGYAKQLETVSANNPRDLLTNLCSGLETFLGFNPSSKGYDGTGIVYSDLDRLCDGMMAFLHGVLESVKDDDNVTTYNEYIDEEHKIDKVLSTLQSKIGSGRGGLSKSVTKVKEWLERYDKEVAKKTKAVTGGLSTLIGKLNSDSSSGAGGNEYYKEVENQENSGLGTQLMGWTSTVQKIKFELNDIETRNIKTLDPTLSAQIMNKVDPITKVVEHLQSVAGNGDFAAKVKAVDSEIDAKEAHVRDEIEKKCKALQLTLKTKFEAINADIDKIGEERTTKLKELLELVAKLETSVITADKDANNLVTRYDSEIAQKLNDINEQVTPLDTTPISSGLNTVFTEVGKQLEALEEKLVELGGLGNAVRINLGTGLENIKLDLQQAIETLKQEIKRNVKAYVEGELPRKIIDKISSFAGNIAHQDGIDGQLDEIVHIARQYAEQFTQGRRDNGLEKTLQKWMEDILDDKGTIKHRIGKYVNDNSNKDTFIRTIKDELTRRISANFPSYLAESNNIKQMILDARDACNKFATTLARKLESGKITTSGDSHPFVKEIATAIDKGVLQKNTEERGYNPEFTFQTAIYNMLKQLLPKVTKAATELEWFAEEAKIGNVEVAIREVKQLGNRLGDEVKAVDDPHKLGNAIQSKASAEAIKGDFKSPLEKLLTSAGRKSLQKQISDLKELTEAVNDKANNEIKQRVESLKKRVAELKSSITNISEQINAFNTSLRTAIDTAKDTVESARYALQKEITDTQLHLNNKVTQAFKAVYDKVKEVFCEQHKADLKALKDLVNEQNAAITEIIRKDKESGVKGLLDKMNTQKGVLDTVKNQNELFFTASYLDLFLIPVTDYIQNEVKTQAKGDYKITKEIKLLCMVFRNIVIGISESKHFSHEVSNRLSKLSEKVNGLKPLEMPDAGRPVLGALQKGMQKFVEELQMQYVNKYEGCQPITQWVTQDTDQIAGQNGNQMDTQNTKLTSDGEKCASVLVTIIANIYEDLKLLRDGCAKHGPCEKKRVYLYEPSPRDGKRTENKLGVWLDHQGFTVSKEKGSHEGELRNKDMFTGNNILTLLENNSIISRPFSDDEAYQGDVVQLYEYFADYLRVCHLKLPKSNTYPSTVRDMLSWMSGLPYTRVSAQIKKHCEKMLEEKDNATGKYPNKEDAVISKILTTDLYYSLSSTCRISYRLLKTICGNGHGAANADYPYACNFADNSRGFHYPDSVSTLIDVLKDMCSRLLRSLYFLRTRCSYDASTANGWRDCRYGKDVSAYQLPCKNSSHSDAECVPKSPLQAHLTDSLPGMLPHAVTSVGCKSTCNTCPKMSPGQPCLTPMGFWDLTTSASINKKGRDIYVVLSDFCKDAESPLCALLRCLQFVSPSPPSSLPDMFSLFCNFFQWRKVDSRTDRLRYGQNADFIQHLTDETIEAAFPLHKWYHENFSNAILTNALTKLEKSVDNHNNPPADDADPKTLSSTHSDLSSITFRSNCKIPGTCGQYMQPLCVHAYHTYSQKQAGLHLSWFVHLAWRFWQLLDCFLKAIQNAQCKSYGCSSCNCGSGKHGDKDACKCDSVVKCGSVVSTFYQYGFTFGSAKTLESTKKCGMFSAQLKRVVYSQQFHDLFDAIDNFIWAIRTPFSYLLLALWSLSLLYLLHIAVVRLDVLRIRSHMRSPSSHRIAAQSLLAAARISSLGNVKYFSP